MDRQRLAVLWLAALLLASGVPGLDSRATGAPEGAHGGGRRPAVPAGFHPGFRGFYGGYGPGFRRYYGYPGWYGVGLGVGLGCALAYPYGYPCYPYPYGYPIYVDPIGGLPPAAAQAQATAPAPGGPVAAGAVQPVRLTQADVILSVHVPADAVVRINGEKTTQTGPHREFMSSGLSPGLTYTFTISARWTGPNGEAVDVQRRLPVQGGERRNIDFLMPAPPASDVPAVDRAVR